ncbi:MAG: hypothetical protein KGL39_35870 [Patescibacteria group bacterium]|nr:hypothetical protein [Patescibacteria group bacterium]
MSCPHHADPVQQRVCPEPERCAHHARLRGDKHCGREFCVKTLPCPEEWEACLFARPDEYEPECLCPCLACHPKDEPFEKVKPDGTGDRYQEIAHVVGKLFGPETERIMREARRRVTSS